MEKKYSHKNSIRVTGNNGSVPEQYFQEFELLIYEDGLAILAIQKSGNRIAESKQLDENRFADLLNVTVSLKQVHPTGLLVGGPQKQIIISVNGKQKILTINNTDHEALDFFNRCLKFYDVGLADKLADIL
ncbi:MAG: hypothetical protein ABFS16_12220 [Bacteroidota bacterium]